VNSTNPIPAQICLLRLAPPFGSWPATVQTMFDAGTLLHKKRAADAAYYEER
jgi:hypothetical protein